MWMFKEKNILWLWGEARGRWVKNKWDDSIDSLADTNWKNQVTNLVISHLVC